MTASNLSQPTPKAAGFRQLAEWAPHESVWLAWPTHAELWEDLLPAAQAEFCALATAIADIDPATKKARGERLDVLVASDEAKLSAERKLAGLGANFHAIPYGDIWLRDSAPVFVNSANGSRAAVRFGFNGWGEKYVLPHDAEISEKIARASGLREFKTSLILEGGSIDTDGEGTALTTRQCLLNKNRNPGMNEAEIESIVRETYGLEKLLWLGDGLINDHTDGHIDTIARFAPGGRVLCMEAREKNDPNREILETIAQDLSKMTDARGRKLEIIRVPSPGTVIDEDGEVMPASFVNFYVANTVVIVPTYGTKYDDEAVRLIGQAFPDRRTIGLSAKAILGGGGAFHCISQQQPL